MRKLVLALFSLLVAGAAYSQGIPGGGGGGSLVSGSTPFSLTGCPNGQYAYNNNGFLGCSTGTGSSSTLTIGTSSVLSGTNGYLLYNNAGILGNATTAANMLTALGVGFGSANGFVAYGGALGTPTSGVGTNITNVNAASLGGATFAAPSAIGSTTPSSGAFTTLSASSTVSGTGFSSYLASPPAIGGTAPAAGSFSSLKATNINGSTQCIHADTAGNLTGTGSDCGAGGGAVSSVSNSDSTLTISPTTGSVVASLNLAKANTWGAKQTFPASVVSASSVNLPHGTAPTSPVNGDLWTTTGGLYAQINGSTVGPLGTGGGGSGTVSSGTIGQPAIYTGTTTVGSGPINLGTMTTGSPAAVLDSQTSGSPYSVITGDWGGLLNITSASAYAVTLPQAGTTGFASGWNTTILNLGAGLVTVTPTTSTINGQSSFILQKWDSIIPLSDGVNYRATIDCGSMANNVPSNVIFGGAGAYKCPVQVSIGTGLSLSGGVLSASGGAGGASITITSAAPSSSSYTFTGTVSYVGSSLANAQVSIYKNGLWQAFVLTDAAGNFSYAATGVFNSDVFTAATEAVAVASAAAGSTPVQDVLAYQVDYTQGALATNDVDTRSGTIATYYNSAGSLQTPGAGANVARFDYDPYSLASRGLLIESADTNLIPYSNDFTNSYWNTTNLTITANTGATTDPAGGNNATLAVLSTNASVTANIHPTTGYGYATGVHTFSVYLKAQLYNYALVDCESSSNNWVAAIVDLSNGIITQQGVSLLSITQFPVVRYVGNGWLRVSLTFDSTPQLVSGCIIQPLASPNYTLGTYGQVTWAGTIGSGIYVYGAQLGGSNLESSYIPTSGASATRNADTLTNSSYAWGSYSVIAETQDRATGLISRAAYAAGSFTPALNKWYRRICVYPTGADATYLANQLTVGAACK
jgi:hypothetical protein